MASTRYKPDIEHSIDLTDARVRRQSYPRILNEHAFGVKILLGVAISTFQAKVAVFVFIGV